MSFFIKNKRGSTGHKKVWNHHLKGPVGFSLSILFLILIYSCQNGEKPRNIKNYFYPVDALDQGIIYEYHPVNNDELPVEYWLFKKLKTDTATYLTGQFYDHNFTVRQFFRAKIVSNGVLMKDYSIYEFDSLRNAIRRPAEILAANSFPFEVKDSNVVFLFKLKWNDPVIEGAYLELVRNRRFRGDAEYIFKNKIHRIPRKVKCVEFIVQELVDDFNDGHWERQYIGKELYAENLGLIYYKKEIDENFVHEYELVDTFSMAVFEEKFKLGINDVQE